MHVSDPEVSEAGWLATQARNLGRLKIAAVLATLFLPVLAVAATVAVESAVTGRWRFPLVDVAITLLFVPVAVFLFRMIRGDQERANRIVGALTRQLTEAVDVTQQQAIRRQNQARRQEFETRLANALDMAEGEPEVIDVIERSFSTLLPSAPVELLLADNSHAHLTRMASSPAGAPGCGVDSPDHCPAARRAQVQRFANSDDLDACPKLRGRSDGPLAAICMPVSIMGRTVGVVHSTAASDTHFVDEAATDLGTLAKLAGARIGLLRVMAETQMQAATDSLTGLLNRRSFETRVAKARRDVSFVSVAMADLDHFKTINDTYGHETGDRALRLFAQVLAGSVRGQDLVGRHGGEEFVVALIGCDGEMARVILNAVRSRLEAAITVAGLPIFTVSFGLVESDNLDELPSIIDRADTALSQAKREGRNRVIRHDPLGVTIDAPHRVDGEPDHRSADRTGDNALLHEIANPTPA